MTLDLLAASDGNGEAVRATVTGIRSAGATVINVDALTNWPANFIATSGTLLADGTLDPATALVFEGHISGSTIVIDSIAPGYTDNGNTVSQVVIVKPATHWADTLKDDLSVSLENDGTLSAGTVGTTQLVDDAVTPAKWTNPYCFRAEASSTNTLPDNVATKMTIDTEIYDYNSNYASSTYTAPVAGVYNFSAAYQITSGVSSGVTINAMIYVNGSQKLSGAVITGPTGNAGAAVSGDCLLAQGDTVEFYAQQDSAGSENVGGSGPRTWFAGHLVHAT